MEYLGVLIIMAVGVVFWEACVKEWITDTVAFFKRHPKQ